MSTASLALAGARDTREHPATRTAFRVAALVAVATVATGAINAATGSGFACETWPGCFHGHFTPHGEVRQVIEFGHRLVAASCVVTVLLAAALSTRLPRSQGLARRMPWVALLGITGSAVFGAITVLDLGLAKPLSVLDLLCALTTMVGMTLATLSLERGAPRWAWTPTARLGAGVAAGLVLMHLLGIVVAGPSSFTSVLGWPLDRVVGRDLLPWLQQGRFVLAVVDGLGVLALCWVARRHRAWRRAALATLAVLLVHLALGQAVLAEGLTMGLSAAYSGLAAVVLFGVLLVTGRAALDPRD